MEATRSALVSLPLAVILLIVHFKSSQFILPLDMPLEEGFFSSASQITKPLVRYHCSILSIALSFANRGPRA